MGKNGEKQMIQKKLSQRFIQIIKDLGKQVACDECSTEIQMGTKWQQICGTFYFHMFRIDISFQSFPHAFSSNNTLFPRIWLRKNEKYIYFSLYDILAFTNMEDFRCFIYSNIQSDEQLDRCMTAIFQGILDYLPFITNLASQDSSVEKFYRKLQAQIHFVLGQDMFHEDFNSVNLNENICAILALDIYYQWTLQHYSTKAYAMFLEGKNARALFMLYKAKIKTVYDAMLIDWLSLNLQSCIT